MYRNLPFAKKSYVEIEGNAVIRKFRVTDLDGKRKVRNRLGRQIETRITEDFENKPIIKFHIYSVDRKSVV